MSSIQEQESKYIINTYGRSPGETPFFVKGEGSYLWDEKGRKYLDMVSGLAVNVLGHCPSQLVEAIKEQSARLIHCSNLYYTQPQVDLARLLVENSFPGKAFFCNSGAEANEAAIKLARKYSRLYSEGKGHEIITAKNSFHGRTMATITATGQPKYHEGFDPMLPGFKYATFNDLETFSSLVGEKTCAIMVEPLQGEGGIHPGTQEFIEGLRELCDKNNLLLIFDEVQCGMGRTGKLFAWEAYGIKPDIMTLAKGLGGGVPIGAMVAREDITRGFNPGDHASTFGGNPLACAAALAVMETLLENGFLEKVQEKSNYFKEKLEELRDKHSLGKEVRGKGFMLALEVEGDGKEILKYCYGEGLIINCIGGKILRFLPPLNISREEMDSSLEILDRVLSMFA
ncbi:MAG: aspartate aminotransferase family protein [Candidatus Syntrophonatronum acetioxidans]|uniref:Acetylornithine aminotransferase n=1 Tax=Candidatus Syntrophonatronum acetioxidans TaxID=1795816 RepID=A0A424YHK8_9FIRM|nr:MAG: aspartate aminotransferase family protein [Candidatus Syntrophonatronum acetioxidans]